MNPNFTDTVSRTSVFSRTSSRSCSSTQARPRKLLMIRPCGVRGLYAGLGSSAKTIAGRPSMVSRPVMRKS